MNLPNHKLVGGLAIVVNVIEGLCVFIAVCIGVGAIIIGGIWLVPGFSQMILAHTQVSAALLAHLGLLFIDCVAALAIVVGYVVLFKALHTILANLTKGQYFVQLNLMAMKRILVVSIIQFAVQVASFFVNATATIHNVGWLFHTTPAQFFGEAVLIVIIYVVWLVFKYGLVVQEDSDSMI
ncbi:hypothetical protein [Lacticaseibacillus jixiensis]|uniref:hypothetical protein n=1 Tax=Lacticaseibacillus jixiensis TaxID=3231926 RepID=UPI0036F25EC5